MSLFLLFFSLNFLTAFGSRATPHESREWPLQTPKGRQRIDGNVLLPMRIALHQNAHASENAESWIMAVSDPQSHEYGQFWKQEDVIEAFKPSDRTIDAVWEWLSSQGVEDVTLSDNKLWLAFDLAAKDAESLFQTEYYEHQLSNGRQRVSCDAYYIPDELQPHVDFIKPGIKDSDITGRSRRSEVRKSASERPRSSRLDGRSNDGTKPGRFENPNDLSLCWRFMTPACFRALYDIPLADPDVPVSPNNSMGIFESGDLYNQDDLNLLFTHFTNIPKGTTPIDDRIDGAQKPPKENAHGQRWHENIGEADMDVQIAMPIVYPQNVTVFQTNDRYWGNQSIYNLHSGLFDTFLDAIDGSFCTYTAYNQTGDDPKVDPIYPDPRKFGYKGKLQCGVFKPTNVISSSYDTYEQDLPVNYQKRQCNEWLKLGLQGVSSFFDSGDFGVGWCWDHDRLFACRQAVGCPWVTSVGATFIPRNHTVYDPETTPSYHTWGHYASGGGFSNIFDTPAYQRDAISHYFETSNPSYPYYFNGQYRNNTGKYNRNGRGFPDVAANGGPVAVYIQTQFGNDGGTSASTPLFASVINRIIEERIRIGKGPLGLINPALYQNPQVLNDIVKGSNGWPFNCSTGSRGFECGVGWDPVTGLGTPNYPKMLDLFLNLP